MNIKTSWIRQELSRLFPKADWQKGVDLNKNGKVEPHERISDFNRNGVVGDPKDWEKFLEKNRPALFSSGPLFYWTEIFNPDNPLFDLMGVEAGITPDENIEMAFTTFQVLMQKIGRLIGPIDPGEANCSSEDERMEIIQRGYQRFMATVISDYDSLLSDFSMNPLSLVVRQVSLTNELHLNLLYQIAAHEMEWPVQTVFGAALLFPRWEVDGLTINIMPPYRKKLQKDLVGEFLSGPRFQAVLNYNRGLAFYRNGKKEAAEEALKKAVELFPNFYPAHYALGILYDATQKYDKALEAFDRAIALHSEYASFWRGRGDVKKRLKKFREAVEDYKKSLEWDPKNYRTLFNLGDCYAALGDNASAEKCMTQALDIEKNVNAYFWRGKFRMRLEKWKEAIEDLNQAEQKGWHNMPLLFEERGKAYAKLGEFSRAAEEFNKMIEKDPSSYSYQVRCHFYADDQKDYELAMADCQRAMELDPKNAWTYVKLGDMHKDRGDFKTAIAYYTKGLERDPSWNSLYHSRGYCYYRLNQNTLALQDLNHYIANAGRDKKLDANAYYSRGLVYFETNRYAEAIKDFDSALALNPDLKDAKNKKLEAIRKKIIGE